MEQLEMCWKVTNDLTPIELPPGYTIEPYKGEEDKMAWCACCRDGMLIDDEHAGAEEFDASMSDGIVVNLYTDVLFLKYHGEAVGTVTAFVRDDGEGELHMVGICPEYRGKGLSKYLNFAGQMKLLRDGVTHVFLTTDEFRKSAIKGYLSAGFLPVDCDVDMKQRWEDVLDSINAEQTAIYNKDLQSNYMIYRKK